MSSLWFSLQKDIFNHRDIFSISFFNHGLPYFLINIYSDFFQLALKYLKDTEVNINNILIMTGNFNIRDSMWDLNFSHHLLHRDILFEVTDFFQLDLSKPTKPFPTRYSDNQQDSNLVINIMFHRPESMKHNNHLIHLNWRLTSNHAFLTVNIHIFKEYVQTRKQTLVKNSEEEEHFLKDLIEVIKEINTTNL